LSLIKWGCPISSAPRPSVGLLRNDPRCLNHWGRFARYTGNGNNMTGDESRKLKVGDRICWKGDATNQGTIRGTSWSGVTIDWDDGDSTSVSHNDTAQVDRTKL
jgi:hypothetical protein